MSYCRWSSEDFTSDVYVYETFSDDPAGLFITHVACSKHDITLPPLPPISEWEAFGFDKVAEIRKQRNALLQAAELVPLNGPHDGESFEDIGLPALLERLLYLQSVGYRVPGYALARIRREILEPQERP